MSIDSRPRIGIFFSDTSDPRKRAMRAHYCTAVQDAGGRPAPYVIQETGTDTVAVARAGLDALDGVVLPGGDDLNPEVYGEAPGEHTRPGPLLDDTYQLSVARAALESHLPVLGICRGSQVLTVANHGRLVQHLLDSPDFGRHDRFPTEGFEPHELAHSVSITEGTLLHQILGRSEISVNSLHHQAAMTPLNRSGGAIRAVSHAPDGTIEAVEVVGHPFALGVQWHPEHLLHLRHARALFQSLVSAAVLHRQAGPYAERRSA